MGARGELTIDHYECVFLVFEYCPETLWLKNRGVTCKKQRLTDLCIAVRKDGRTHRNKPVEIKSNISWRSQGMHAGKALTQMTINCWENLQHHSLLHLHEKAFIIMLNPVTHLSQPQQNKQTKQKTLCDLCDFSTWWTVVWSYKKSTVRGLEETVLTHKPNFQQPLHALYSLILPRHSRFEGNRFKSQVLSHMLQCGGIKVMGTHKLSLIMSFC